MTTDTHRRLPEVFPQFREERFNMLYSCREFVPWLAGSGAKTSWLKGYCRAKLLNSCWLESRAGEWCQCGMGEEQVIDLKTRPP